MRHSRRAVTRANRADNRRANFAANQIFVVAKIARTLEAKLEKIRTGADILENYVVEDNGLSYATIGQGLCIYKGKLLMPTGLGTPEYPSYLFVWDLNKKRPVEVLDMGLGTTGELEDCAHFKGNRYLVQGQHGLFEMVYKGKKK